MKEINMAKSNQRKREEKSYTFAGQVWRYPGDTAVWHFLTLPKALSAELSEVYHGQHRGWKSLPVRVAIRGVEWDTSIFFDKREGAYLLPLKAAIRKKGHMAAGEKVEAVLRVCSLTRPD